MSQNSSKVTIPVVLMPKNVGAMSWGEIRDHLDQHYQGQVEQVFPRGRRGEIRDHLDQHYQELQAAEEQFPEESSLSEDDPHYSPTWKCE